MREEARAAQPFDRPPTQREWEKELANRGWIAPAWPKQYGGAGLSVMQQFIFNEEMAEAPRSATRRHRHRHGRTHHHHDRHRRAAARTPAADPQRRHNLVPGLLRTRLRLRPRLAPNPRGQRR